MRLVPFLACLSLLAAGGAASAQSSEQDFHDQTLRALERIERALERLERRLDAQPAPAAERDDEVVAATSELCGTLMANCQNEALRYCARLSYRRAVPVRIEPRGSFNYLVRVRCFN